MPEKTYYCPEIDSVCVDSFDEVSLNDVEQSIKESAILLSKFQSQQLIVDVTKQKVSLELVDTFELCKNLIQQLPSDLRIAYLVNDPPKQPHRFFQLLSESLGYPVQAFFKMEDALAWFRGEDSHSVYPVLGKIKFPGKECFTFPDFSSEAHSTDHPQ